GADQPQLPPRQRRLRRPARRAGRGISRARRLANERGLANRLRVPAGRARRVRARGRIQGPQALPRSRTLALTCRSIQIDGVASVVWACIPRCMGSDSLTVIWQLLMMRTTLESVTAS